VLCCRFCTIFKRCRIHSAKHRVPAIADGLNISRAEVHGVITYYHFFRQHPAGKHVVQICRAEACQARGCEDLVPTPKKCWAAISTKSPTMATSRWKPSIASANAPAVPAVQIDDDLYARVSKEKFNRLIQAKRGVQ
jgi:formate dehydrogenase subunit gamma